VTLGDFQKWAGGRYDDASICVRRHFISRRHFRFFALPALGAMFLILPADRTWSAEFKSWMEQKNDAIWQMPDTSSNATRMPDPTPAPMPVNPNENSDPFHSPARNDPVPSTNYSNPSTTTAPREFSKEQYEFLKNSAVGGLTDPKMQPAASGGSNSTSTAPASMNAPMYIPPKGHTFPDTDQKALTLPNQGTTKTPATNSASPRSNAAPSITTTTSPAKTPGLSGFGVSRQDAKKIQSASGSATSTPTQTSIGDAIGKPNKFIDYSSQMKTNNAVTTPAYRPAPTYRPAPRVNCAQLHAMAVQRMMMGDLSACYQLQAVCPANVARCG